MKVLLMIIVLAFAVVQAKEDRSLESDFLTAIGKVHDALDTARNETMYLAQLAIDAVAFSEDAAKIKVDEFGNDFLSGLEEIEQNYPEQKLCFDEAEKAFESKKDMVIGQIDTCGAEGIQALEFVVENLNKTLGAVQTEVDRLEANFRNCKGKPICQSIAVAETVAKVPGLLAQVAQTAIDVTQSLAQHVAGVTYCSTDALKVYLEGTQDLLHNARVCAGVAK